MGARPPAIGSSIKTIFERYSVLNLLFSRLRVLNLVDLVICYTLSIEVLFVKVHMFVLLIFASLPECSQNQTAVSDTLRLLSDF